MFCVNIKCVHTVSNYILVFPRTTCLGLVQHGIGRMKMDTFILQETSRPVGYHRSSITRQTYSHS